MRNKGSRRWLRRCSIRVLVDRRHDGDTVGVGHAEINRRATGGEFTKGIGWLTTPTWAVLPFGGTPPPASSSHVVPSSHVTLFWCIANESTVVAPATYRWSLPKSTLTGALVVVTSLSNLRPLPFRCTPVFPRRNRSPKITTFTGASVQGRSRIRTGGEARLQGRRARRPTAGTEVASRLQVDAPTMQELEAGRTKSFRYARCRESGSASNCARSRIC